MAREESDREDLMREATAYPRRAELRVPGEPELVFVGIREVGTSVYFGPDPVYHLDVEQRLRRAYVGGELYRTQGTTLARLRRKREEKVTELLRHDLDPDELGAFLDSARERLRGVVDAIRGDAVSVVRQLPVGDDELLADVAAHLRGFLEAEDPLAPAVPGRV